MSMVNGQTTKNVIKTLTCGCSCGYRAYGRNPPLPCNVSDCGGVNVDPHFEWSHFQTLFQHEMWSQLVHISPPSTLHPHYSFFGNVIPHAGVSSLAGALMVNQSLEELEWVTAHFRWTFEVYFNLGILTTHLRLKEWILHHYPHITSLWLKCCLIAGNS